MKTVLIVGAGSRGSAYAECLLPHRERVRIVGVAEPREVWRERLVKAHEIPAEHVFTDWRQAADRPRFADAVLICTPDNLHVDPALAFAGLGYHMLLEKPMAPAAADCRAIAAAVDKAGILFAVCHVLRYAHFTQTLVELLRKGVIGDPASVQHLEPVGYWHQAHSFVRGNWRKEAESSFMLLAKSCHDLDWLAYVMNSPIRRVSSFGALRHFRQEQAPAGATGRCLDCPVEPRCAYSAKKIYLGGYAKGWRGWPLDILAAEPTEASLLEALRTGPYGRCVYRCDNDVVDHQVVGMEFEGAQTGVFTMTAFTAAGQHRKTKIFGTNGELYFDCQKVEVHDFRTDRKRTYRPVARQGAGQGHGGADGALIDAFVHALCTGNGSSLLSGAKESLATHLAVFAAERARREGLVVEVRDEGL
jgi:predicted dehydrogenase